MHADDIYRFVLLRQAASKAPQQGQELNDPFIPAYSRNSIPSRQSLRGSLGLALSTGAVTLAQQQAQSHLLVQNVGSPWDLLGSERLRRLCHMLPDIVKSGDVDAAELACVQAMDARDFSSTISRIQEIVVVRDALADYLSASSLINIPGQEDAAHLICCLETVERLMAIADEGEPPSPVRAAWRLPLSAGVVELPFHVKFDWPFGSPLAGEKGDPNTMLNAGRTFRPRSFVGDLIVMKQHLRSYELGEIAHVSNVLAGEMFERTHRTLDRSETRLLDLEESEKQTDLDLQSTTRDEMNSEIQKSLSEQTDLSAHFDVTATYMGPAITVAASVGGSASYRRASEERTSTSVTHAREVVNRASEQIRTRTLKQREAVESRETEEKASHTISNTTAEHQVGIYRWLEKRFDLHLVNYGRRRIYEFIVPEPGVFWTRLMNTQGKQRTGPPPQRPMLANDPLALSHFALRTNANAPVAVPALWNDLIYLAGQWGVTLEAPPVPNQQCNFAFSLPGSETADSSTSGARFENGFTVSPYVKVSTNQDKLTVPAGYRAYSGELAMKGWRYLRKNSAGNYMMVDGEANLLMAGQRYRFTTNNETANSGIPEGGVEAPLVGPGGVILGVGLYLEGEVPIALASNLNTLSCSIKLDCQRTEVAEKNWARRMFLLFEAAYRDRLAAYEDEESRAAIRTEDWAANLPSQRAREIERDELKRAVVLQISDAQVHSLTAQLLNDSSDSQEVPPLTTVSTNFLPPYERFVSFFEKAFDWNNIAYVFSPYFYGRRDQWASLATADHADPQFRRFLGAGAARVQVPVCRGFEAHVEYFFNGLGMLPFERRLPWLASMRPIAEDLAADAREGFTLGDGKVSIAAASHRLVGANTVFNAALDVGREIRLAGQVYIIDQVVSSTEVLLSKAWRGAALNNAYYELGGIVVGPAIPLKLPTTLVVVDKPNLSLPAFPGRYVE